MRLLGTSWAYHPEFDKFGYTVITQNDFSTGLGQQLVASKRAAGTDITIEFWRLKNIPASPTSFLTRPIAVASSLNSTYGSSVTFHRHHHRAGRHSHWDDHFRRRGNHPGHQHSDSVRQRSPRPVFCWLCANDHGCV